MRLTGSRGDHLREAERQIAWALDHPHVSTWLKDALRAALLCDPVVVVNEVEMLRELLRFRMDAIIQNALGETAGCGSKLPL